MMIVNERATFEDLDRSLGAEANGGGPPRQDEEPAAPLTMVENLVKELAKAKFGHQHEWKQASKTFDDELMHLRHRGGKALSMLFRAILLNSRLLTDRWGIR